MNSVYRSYRSDFSADMYMPINRIANFILFHRSLLQSMDLPLFLNEFLSNNCNNYDCIYKKIIKYIQHSDLRSLVGPLLEKEDELGNLSKELKGILSHLPFEHISAKVTSEELSLSNDNILQQVSMYVIYHEKDASYERKLADFLAPLIRAKNIQYTSKFVFLPGTNLQEVEKESIANSNIILCLFTANLLSDPEVYDSILKINDSIVAGKPMFVPIQISRCLIEDTPFGKFYRLPHGNKSIKSFLIEEDAYYEIANGIKKLIDSFY